MKKLYTIVCLIFLSLVLYGSESRGIRLGTNREALLVADLLRIVNNSDLSDRDLVINLYNLYNHASPREIISLVSMHSNECRLNSIERKDYIFRPNQVIFHMTSTRNDSLFKFIVEPSNGRYCRENYNAAFLGQARESQTVHPINYPGSNGTYTGEDSF